MSRFCYTVILLCGGSAVLWLRYDVVALQRDFGDTDRFDQLSRRGKVEAGRGSVPLSKALLLHPGQSADAFASLIPEASTTARAFSGFSVCACRV
ncbi:hypothetical protein ACL02S_03270 [Nocardia sp. 004]|uniref:hypothetical protein n=1 Tax=Nocardia sp. 004 TaxID=3385978 RepID=UPI0039A0FA6C